MSRDERRWTKVRGFVAFGSKGTAGGRISLAKIGGETDSQLVEHGSIARGRFQVLMQDKSDFDAGAEEIRKKADQSRAPGQLIVANIDAAAGADRCQLGQM